MSQFEPTGERIAQEIDFERYGDPEKVRMRAALEELTVAYGRAAEALGTIHLIATRAPAADRDRTSAMSRISELARQGLAP